ncbi:ABC transporter substrate-binding protein [Halalkalicoccus subterraneus]|uniref:ABC transporter substrate-binding protein n=1 Tax=Halalkalicoccus subterraneus TaxID=2675002 RepID=UPI000EFB3A3A|nr:ABC transporter substrate-binding protein [Halalkalicoccus subterraneus]
MKHGNQKNGDLDSALSRRRFLGGTGAAVASGSMSGCVDDLVGGATGDGTFSAEVTVTHWPLLMYNPPYQAALENGYFEEEGVEIEGIAGSEGGGTTVRNVVTGGLPFGEVATPGAVNGYYAGSDITIVAATVNTPGTINWVAPQGSEIESMADLEGGTIGYTSAGSVTENTGALSVARADELDVDDVEFQGMGGVSEGLTGLEEGAIDVAANMDPIFSSQQAGEEQWQVVFRAADYIPEFMQTVIIVGPETIENDPDAIEGYIRARNRGVEFVRDNPQEAAEIYASYNEGFDTEVMEMAIENADVDSYYATGEFSVEGLELIEEGMQNIGLIDHDVEWSEIIDQSYLEDEKHIDLSEAE